MKSKSIIPEVYTQPRTILAVDPNLPIGVIYYGHNIRKKKYTFNESDITLSLQLLLVEGYKHI